MKRWDALALLSVVGAALLLRLGDLGLIHDRGDQIIWAALARNVQANGLRGYTVRHVDDGLAMLGSGVALRGFFPTDGVGTVVSGLVSAGEAYWDRPLANQPPAFTYLLVASHALVGEEGDPFPLLARATNLEGATHEERLAAEERFARAVARDPPPRAVRAQLWATLPVLLSDLATVALVFLLARRLGGSARAALVAAAIYAFDPLALYCAHRVLSNATLAAATAGTGLALLAMEKDRRLAPVAGLLAGLACLVKASAIFLIPLPVGWRRPAYWLTALVLLAPWSIVCWRLLGHPLGLAWQTQDDWIAGSGWAQVVTGRGATFYVHVLARSPFIFFGLLTSFAWVVLGDRTPEARVKRSLAVFALLVLLAAQRHTGGKEGRHILHVYPVLAVAASTWIDRLGPDRRRALLAAVGLAIVLFLEARLGLRFAYSTANLPP